MSPSSSPSADSNPLSGVLDSVNSLISPRAGAEAPTVLTNVAGIASKTASLVGHTVATGADILLGVPEAIIAGGNNAVGLITKHIDEAIVAPIDKTRKAMFDLLAHPIKTLSA